MDPASLLVVEGKRHNTCCPTANVCGLTWASCCLCCSPWAFHISDRARLCFRAFKQEVGASSSEESASHSSQSTSSSPRGHLPYSNSKGENLVEAWGASPIANKTHCGQSYPLSPTNFHSIRLRVPLKRSTCPLF